MIDLEELPDLVADWQKKASDLSVYLSTSHNGLAAIINKNVVSFGFYKPCGANIKKVSVENNEEVIRVLTEFKL